jgi:hypothetical protein
MWQVEKSEADTSTHWLPDPDFYSELFLILSVFFPFPTIFYKDQLWRTARAFAFSKTF